uniref:Uncharacterized protein n=1 Tax=Nyssomyia neivai TaxID=330878 RepID=A0A1L8D6S9_9DIPT
MMLWFLWTWKYSVTSQRVHSFSLLFFFVQNMCFLIISFCHYHNFSFIFNRVCVKNCEFLSQCFFSFGASALTLPPQTICTLWPMLSNLQMKQ